MSREPIEADMRKAKFGQVFNRPQYQPNVRIMCIAPFRDTVHGGWTGVVLTDPSTIGRSETPYAEDWVADGWALVDED